MKNTQCYHCGNHCNDTKIKLNDKVFCCNGCKTVFEIFTENDLTCYYDFQNNPGAIPNEIKGKYDFLDSEEISQKLLDFNNNNTQIVTLYIPHIHCSSCIWILENLHKLNKNVNNSQVNFPKKTVRITFNAKNTSLKELVILLSSVGYEPYISLEDYEVEKKKVDRTLLYKLGIAGFAFGNVMFLSFPEYFEVNEYWLEKFKHIFRWVMFAFSLPVVFYAAQDYFTAAFKGIKNKILNIDIPIALGIFVLFVRSTTEIIFDIGTGFFDSLTGLVFFLLLGKFFQQKTYNFLSFERDYKSYFPIAVTKINKDESEENIQIYDVKKGDRLLIRSQELIPTDGILINGNAQVDYSFVTGEADAVKKKSGDKVFAGGKQLGEAIEIEVLHAVSQSYLTQLWSNDVFQKDKTSSFKNITDTISKHFTVAILSIAIIATSYWLFIDTSKALNVFTAILIIACPCAIALAAPFTMGNMLRIFGKLKFYLKNALVVEQLAQVNYLIFDKTGTITTNTKNSITYLGDEISYKEKGALKSLLRASNHPLSRNLYHEISVNTKTTIHNFSEKIGKGLQGTFNKNTIKVGSASYVKDELESNNLNTSVHVSINNSYKGKFIFKNSYRKGVSKLFKKLNKHFHLAIVSGDNQGEKEFLKKILPKKTQYLFNQKPKDKLNFVAKLQKENYNVAMIGDGLNDAGALAQSNVGIALSENINVFSPACDAILDAEKLDKLNLYIHAAKKAVTVVKYCFLLSLVYNVIGLYFAITGQLTPVIAAILMPLSSISIVIFTTISTNIIGNKLK
ncbi:heavy metal translocating P-type ATPase [Tenacibaculum geojense]|uniref:Heavy metal translocating P-type ATPase n=1 Tax=Tenacibaculum geojense TaxID=915352 RepID=A0ABW3JVJ1_9FLAO